MCLLLVYCIHIFLFMFFFFFFFKQKTAYEMRISDWSSDVCSSDLPSPKPCSHLDFMRDPRGVPIPFGEISGLVSAPVSNRSGIAVAATEIGRASCRERVCQYV